ncbi:hypothetical protein [Acinetobacter soli]|uniref:hypothetical protein n=1 Tax=Acinetobacter soli TaxID=487316 RepID=UPI00123121B4|nr:hypothetical protein [Acinetobacter soli]
MQGHAMGRYYIKKNDLYLKVDTDPELNGYYDYDGTEDSYLDMSQLISSNVRYSWVKNKDDAKWFGDSQSAHYYLIKKRKKKFFEGAEVV